MEKKPFTNYKLEEEKDPNDIRVTVRLNKEEKEMLDHVRKIIKQPKDSTLIKTLMCIGYYDVIHDKKTKYIIDKIFNNDRKNKRTGLEHFD